MKILSIMALCIGMMYMSCSRPTSEGRMGEPLYTMQELPHKRFALDDSTTQVLSYIHTFMEGDSLRLASFNKPLKNICIFDVQTGKELRKIQFFKEGPHAVGNNLCGFLLLNNDSILMYYTGAYQLDLMNSQGELLARYRLKDIKPQADCAYSMPSPSPSSSLPIRKAGNAIILQGFSPDKVGSLLRGTTILFNLRDSTLKYANDYPSCYQEKDFDKWHVQVHLTPRYDLGPQDEMVLSYPIEDSIRIFNPQTGEKRSFFAGHSTPYKIRPASASTTAEQERSILGQAQYTGIYYDRWNQLYYRLMALPMKDYTANASRLPSRELAVIIIDKDFKKVGEYNVREKSDRCSFAFVSPEGLHINVLSDNDDFMDFITLKPQKL